jgi:hypothetical protein
MPTFVPRPTVVRAAGEPPKIIEEFVAGSTNQLTEHREEDERAGLARAGQAPEFDEYILYCAGNYRCEPETRLTALRRDKPLSSCGRMVRYGTAQGADYIAVCLPAFSPETVHRENQRAVIF